MGIPAPLSQTPPAADQANAVVAGSFTGTGQSAPFLSGKTKFNVVIYGAGGPNGAWTGTVRLERSFDGGTTWIVAGHGDSGLQMVFSAPDLDVSLVVNEPELGVLYRLNCTAYTSGTINYRLSTTGSYATTRN